MYTTYRLHVFSDSNDLGSFEGLCCEQRMFTGLVDAMPGLPAPSVAMAGMGPSLGDPKRVLSLMTKPLSSDLLERHLVSIRHLCNENARGCPLQSLPELTQILAVVLESSKAHSDGQLVNATCSLLK